MNNYKPSSELHRIANERHNNVLRHVKWLQKTAKLKRKEYVANYKDKQLGADYEAFLDKIGHP